MHLSGRTYGARPSVSKGARLLMTTRARLFLIEGQPRVVEEVTAKLHLGGTHRIVCRDARQREAGWQFPGISRGLLRRQSLHREKQPGCRDNQDQPRT